jgi:predicted alpha/beta superfamily hydrolase
MNKNIAQQGGFTYYIVYLLDVNAGVPYVTATHTKILQPGFPPHSIL